MKTITFSKSIRFFIVLMFSMGLISAGIQERKCNTGHCSHVSIGDLKFKSVKSIRPLFEKIFLI
ncbi:MAG TPA: hypothetical protein VK166_02790 [Chitinophagaceae bacterium]|nr:hypothetical protein [Chitinophagaceae bacterium]